MSSASEPVYLVDSSIYIFRAYFSMPDTFRAANGESVNAVYGYTSFLLDLLDRSPQFISCAFDESLNTCYRNTIYPEYKANRELPDANLEYQLAQCQRVTALMGLHGLALKDYEADDIIGTLQKKLAADRQAIIVTRDKDLGQLLGPEDQLWDFAADDVMGPQEVRAKFGVEAAQIADYLALAGDTVDNIPGAPGIGAKTAASLLNHFGSIDDLYARIEEVETIGIRGAKKAQQTLIDNEALIRMYRSITGIHCDIEIDLSLDDLTLSRVDDVDMATFCEEMNFGQRVRQRLAALSD